MKLNICHFNLYNGSGKQHLYNYPTLPSKMLSIIMCLAFIFHRTACNVKKMYIRVWCPRKQDCILIIHIPRHEERLRTVSLWECNSGILNKRQADSKMEDTDQYGGRREMRLNWIVRRVQNRGPRLEFYSKIIYIFKISC